jgi:SPASM domain peptide maturase of grasp-with-spasm system
LSIIQEGNNMSKERFLLFSNCIPFKGHTRSIIVDTQYGDIHPIPNEMYAVLKKYKGSLLSEVKKDFESADHEILDGYYEHLDSKGLIMKIDSPKDFPDIELRWKYPGVISNAIIDFDASSSYPIEPIVSQLETLGCKFVEIRIYSAFTLNQITKIIRHFDGSRIKGISLLTSFNPEIKDDDWAQFLIDFGRVESLAIHSSPENRTVDELGKMSFAYITQQVNSESHCGNILGYFTLNLKFLSESQTHNSCLNQKISIDVNGEIKNCPSMKKSFGNITNTTLWEALQDQDFKKLWNINKDKVHVCKDCEFRYICTDCRAYVEDPNDLLSKPLKCGYNPYAGEWGEWTTNPLKQNTIDAYGMRKVVNSLDPKLTT